MPNNIKNKHTMELLTYGLVGGSAWCLQTIVYIAAIHLAVFPSVAMLLGNMAGMVISYFGHVRFTFKRTHKFSTPEFIRFVATSIFGLCLNVGGVRVITKVLFLNPHYGVIPTIFTPLITYLISKFWAFK